MRTIPAAVLAAAVAVSAQQLPQGGGEQLYVTAIDVVADVRDAKGDPPPGLKPSDFVVIDEGIERTVAGVEYLGAPRIAGAIGKTRSGTLRAVTNVDLVKRLLGPGAKGHFRITLAAQIGKEAVIVNRPAPDYDLAESIFRFRTPLDLPSSATGLLLVIEETTTGAWGSTRIDIPSATAPVS